MPRRRAPAPKPSPAKAATTFSSSPSSSALPGWAPPQCPGCHAKPWHWPTTCPVQIARMSISTSEPVSLVPASALPPPAPRPAASAAHKPKPVPAPPSPRPAPAASSSANEEASLYDLLAALADSSVEGVRSSLPAFVSLGQRTAEAVHEELEFLESLLSELRSDLVAAENTALDYKGRDSVSQAVIADLRSRSA